MPGRWPWRASCSTLGNNSVRMRAASALPSISCAAIGSVLVFRSRKVQLGVWCEMLPGCGRSVARSMAPSAARRRGARHAEQTIVRRRSRPGWRAQSSPAPPPTWRAATHWRCASGATRLDLARSRHRPRPYAIPARRTPGAHSLLDFCPLALSRPRCRRRVRYQRGTRFKKLKQEEMDMSALPISTAANDPDDPDGLETQEWLDALATVLEREGPQRAHYLLEKLIDKARRSGAYFPFSP